VLLLDHMFVHRLSGAEGKDGNPLNEVRVLVNSLLYNGGKLQITKLPAGPTRPVVRSSSRRTHPCSASSRVIRFS
jgi:hypothetical protein